MRKQLNELKLTKTLISCEENYEEKKSLVHLKWQSETRLTESNSTLEVKKDRYTSYMSWI